MQDELSAIFRSNRNYVSGRGVTCEAWSKTMRLQGRRPAVVKIHKIKDEGRQSELRLSYFLYIYLCIL